MKKLLKNIAISMMVVMLSVSLAGCSKSNSKELKVGLECAYAPFNWTQTTDANGAVPISGTKEYAGGYDIEIAKKLAAGMGKELVIVKTEWDGLVPAVQSGMIDVIIAGMSPTADRKKTIDFSDNYYKSDLVMVVKKGSAFEKAASIQDFKGAKVTAQQNTFHYSVIDQITGVKKETAMVDFSSMRVALESGMIDGYVSERPEGISATSANSKFTMISFTADKGFKASDDDIAVAVGMKKGNKDLNDKINQTLKGITEEQRLKIMDEAIKNQPISQK
jgi:putative lysine transport system substrate-binding protein